MALAELSSAVQGVPSRVTEWAGVGGQWHSHTHLCHLSPAIVEQPGGNSSGIPHGVRWKEMESDGNSSASKFLPTKAQDGKRSLERKSSSSKHHWSVFPGNMKHPARRNSEFSSVAVISWAPYSLYKQQLTKKENINIKTLKMSKHHPSLRKKIFLLFWFEVPGKVEGEPSYIQHINWKGGYSLQIFLNPSAGKIISNFHFYTRYP